MAIHNEGAPEMKNLATFLKWFYPLECWVDMLMFEFLKNTRVQWIVIIFYKPQYFMQHGPATQLATLPSSWIHKTYLKEVYENPFDLKNLQKYLCQINKIISSEIWPSGTSQAPWDVQKNPPTPYQKQLKEALNEYRTNIPDPKEWSQKYPMYCSQAVQDTPAWKDLHEAGSSQKSNRKSKATLLPSYDDDVIPPDNLEKRIVQLELKSYRAREEKRRKVEEFNMTSDIDTDYDIEETLSLS
ncbi:hypothetical protein Goklo_011476 [Gossypium klotzschianum]|uniref:Uncharacterized protein n=1 Tax=Gossypium klotzschianum TaxID=34286 RepID=A0A7J8VA65_9ROSI|nr:hypothetical protein [Gossypium klotzschianum]